MKFLLMKFFGFLIKTPKRKLRDTPEDYYYGQLWAKTRPHPFLKNKTMWDFCYDKSQKLYTIYNINKFLFKEI